MGKCGLEKAPYVDTFYAVSPYRICLNRFQNAYWAVFCFVIISWNSELLWNYLNYLNLPVFGLNTEIYEVSIFNPNTGKYGPEITPYLDTFHAVFFLRLLGDRNSFDKNLFNVSNKKYLQSTAHLTVEHLLSSCRTEYWLGRVAFSVNTIG